MLRHKFLAEKMRTSIKAQTEGPIESRVPATACNVFAVLGWSFPDGIPVINLDDNTVPLDRFPDSATQGYP
jgi:hypothetical protein